MYTFYRDEYQDEYNTTENFEKQPESEKEVDGFFEIYNDLYKMRQEIIRIRRPVGSKENPGRSCRDLYYGHPHFTDGKIK